MTETIKYVKCIYNKGTLSDQMVIGDIYEVDRINGVFLHLKKHPDIGINYGLHPHNRNLNLNGHTGFKAATEEEWLLQEAKRRYPVGTLFQNDWLYEMCRFISNSDFQIYNSIAVGKVISIGGNWVYRFDTKTWAEIVEPVIKSEDGVKLYEGDEYWWVNIGKYNNYKNFQLVHNKKCTIDKGDNKNWPISTKVFSTKKAAQNWIDENKPKDEFVLPEKWCIKRTAKNYDIITNYMNKTYGTHYIEGNIGFPFIHFEPIIKSENRSHNRMYKGFTEITFDQFKKYVMKKDKVENPCKSIKPSKPSKVANKPVEILTPIQAQQELRDVADDLNGKWQPAHGQNKYFIYHNGDDYKINQHQKIMYAEITYFKTKKLAKKAMEILGEEKFNLIFRR